MGIDSLHNVSGAQAGALSLASGMFWDWNSGYIMLKAEGDSPNSPTGKFALHLGGFSGTNNIVTVKTAEFGKTVKVTNGTTPTMTFTVNPARLWHTSPGLATLSVIPVSYTHLDVYKRQHQNFPVSTQLTEKQKHQKPDGTQIVGSNN